MPLDNDVLATLSALRGYPQSGTIGALRRQLQVRDDTLGARPELASWAFQTKADGLQRAVGIEPDRFRLARERLSNISGGYLGMDTIDRMAEVPGPEPENPYGFWQKASRFVGSAAKEIARSFYFWEDDISGRERAFRVANTASLALPVGLSWSLARSSLGASLPTLRAIVATARGRVALGAVEAAAINVGLEAIRDPEERGEHGLALAGVTGLVGGAAGAALVNRAVRTVRKAKWDDLVKPFEEPAVWSQVGPENPFLTRRWAILTADSGMAPTRAGLTLNARRHSELVGRLNENGMTHLPVRVARNGRQVDGVLLPGVSSQDAASIARSLGTRYVATHDGLLDVVDGLRYKLPKGSGLKVGTAIDPRVESFVAVSTPGGPGGLSFLFDPLGVTMAERLKLDGRAALESVMDQEGFRGFWGRGWDRLKNLNVGDAVTRMYSEVIRGRVGSEIVDDLSHGLRRSGLGTDPEAIISGLRGPGVGQGLSEWVEGAARSVDEDLGKMDQLARSHWNGWVASLVKLEPRSFRRASERLLSKANGNPLKSMEEIFTETGIVTEELKDFDAYLLAQRFIFLKDVRKLPIPKAIEDNLDVVRETVRDAPGHFRTAFERIADWYDTSTYDVLVGGRVVDERQLNEWRKLNPLFVPLTRREDILKDLTSDSGDFAALFREGKTTEALEAGARSSDMKIAGAPKRPIKRLQTSEIMDDARYASPLEEMVRRLAAYGRMADQQIVVNHHAARAVDAPDLLGSYMREVADPQTVARVSQAKGVVADLDPNHPTTTSSIRLHEGKRYLRARTQKFDQDGQPYLADTWFEVTDPLLWNSMKQLGPTEVEPVFRMLGGPATLVRAATTGAAEFVAKNAPRDLAFGFINAGLNPMAFVKGMAHLWKKDDLYVTWVNSGATRAALASMDRKTLQTLVDEASSSRTAGGEAWRQLVKGVAHPWQAFLTVSEWAENATRIGAFESRLQALIREAESQGATLGKTTSRAGKTIDYDTLVREAAVFSRDVTVDFQSVGANKWANTIRIGTPFWGAALSSADNMARAFASNPTGFMLRAAATVTLPSVGLWAINRKDPDYRDLPQWEKDLFWHFKRPQAGMVGGTAAGAVAGGVLGGLPGAAAGAAAGAVLGKAAGGAVSQALGEDPEDPSDDLWLRWPKPFEVGIWAGSMVEHFLDAVEAEDPEGVDAFVAELQKTILEGYVPHPTVWAPISEVLRNEVNLTGAPVVPAGLEGVDPGVQSTQGTSYAAKGLAAMWNAGIPDPAEHVSPVVIEHLLRGYTGSVGRYFYGGLGDIAVNATHAAGLGEVQSVSDPERELMEVLPGVRAFVSTFPDQSQSVANVYRLADRAQTVANTQKYLLESLRTDDYADYTIEHALLLGAGQILDPAVSRLQELRAVRLKIEEAPGMAPNEKRRAIRELNEAARTITRSIEIAIRDGLGIRAQTSTFGPISISPPEHVLGGERGGPGGG